MQLIEAHLRGFGRLVERSFRFGPGVNLVLGPNEAGKSTLQQFVLGALFGMKREDRKRRDYLPAHDRYRPWDGAPYAGTLVYELSSGERFEVRRNFEREHEDVQILDPVTGRDRTQEFEVDARKERAFLAQQLQLRRSVFEATTSVGQLAARPQEEGIQALKERIQGLVDSGDEARSARAALLQLAQLRDSFGSERTPTRGAGKLLEERRTLQQEAEEARQRHAEILELTERRTGILTRLAQVEAVVRRQRAAERLQHLTDLSRQLQQAEGFEARLAEARARLESYADVADVEPAANVEARTRQAAVGPLEHEVRGLGGKLELLRRREAELGQIEARLQRALAGMDRARARALAARAAWLHERVGRLREARLRQASEQRENRGVVEGLRLHFERDWTRDEFMEQLTAERRSLQDPEPEQLTRDAQSSRAAQARLVRRVGLALALGVALAGAAGFGVWHVARTLPALLRTVLATLPSLLILVGLRGGVTRLVTSRDALRALDAHAERVRTRRAEAERWIQEALQRNGRRDAEDFFVARREYEALRTRAARSAEISARRERSELETEIASEAAALRADIRACSLPDVEALLASPPPAASPLLPFAEEPPPDDPMPEEGPEIARLLDDLRQVPVLRRAFDWLERLGEHVRVRREELAGLAAEHDAKAGELEGTGAALATLLRRNGAADLDQLVARVVRHSERAAVVREYEALQRERAAVLGERSLEALREGIAAMQPEPDGAPVALALATQETDPNPELGPGDAGADALQELERLREERAQVEARLEVLESAGRLPAEVELGLVQNEVALAQERERDSALQLAIDTLDNVAAQAHRQIAPQLNARLGELFARLSRGSHTQVHLDEDLTPRVRVTGEALADAGSLSGGAADQLYFALRITVGELLARGGERLPLLLDDPFVQYDPERLGAALDLVVELAGEHQVLLFTCDAVQAEALERRAVERGVACDRLQL